MGSLYVKLLETWQEQTVARIVDVHLDTPTAAETLRRKSLGQYDEFVALLVS